MPLTYTFILILVHSVSSLDACPYRLYWFNINNSLFGVTDEVTDITTAQNCCKNLGSSMRLATLMTGVDSTAIFNFIQNKYSSPVVRQFWVDARRINQFSFVWPDGSSVLWNLWASGEPQSTDDCARLRSDMNKLAGYPCSTGNFSVFCQGYIPTPSVSSTSYCSVPFTWMPISDWMYGVSTAATTYSSARNCCASFGPYFRLAILDDTINTTAVLLYLKHKYTSGGFWVDAARPGFDVTKNFTWSNGKPVSLWSVAVNEPNSYDYIARLELNLHSGDPKLYGTTFATTYYVLCQEWLPQATVLTTITDTSTKTVTPATSTVASVTAVKTSVPTEKIPTTCFTTEESLTTSATTEKSATFAITEEPATTFTATEGITEEPTTPFTATEGITEEPTTTFTTTEGASVSNHLHETTVLLYTEATTPERETELLTVFPTSAVSITTQQPQSSIVDVSTMTATAATPRTAIPAKCCACQCKTDTSGASKDLDGRVKHIRRDLLVDKRNLSSALRKLKCTEDFRLSARTIGLSGTSLMIVFLLLVPLCSDFSRLLKFVWR